MTDSVIIEHYGIKRRSGRYPWGSGGELIETTNRLSKLGFSEVEIAKSLNISTTELRNQKALAKAEIREAQRMDIIRQKERGLSIEAISEQTHIPPSTIRDLLKPNANAKYRIIKRIAEMLVTAVKKFGYVDVGDGVERFLLVTRTKLDNAIALLKNQGYQIHYLSVEQMGTGKRTSVMVLTGPDVDYKTVLENQTKIGIPNYHSEDNGLTFVEIPPIKNLSSSRVTVQYNSKKDGLIELRNGVEDLSLGGKQYAQVRIGVDGTHYMKGMAIQTNDIPKGYDVVYHTSKSDTGNKLDIMKEQVSEGASVFGAVTVPKMYLDSNGTKQQGVINVVGEKTLNEEGAWAGWDRNLASQVLSKQPPRIAKKQLDVDYQNRLSDYEEIKTITNPTVKKHLLNEFADSSDRAAIDLKAAALPRQTTNVILPDPTIKPSDVYAPNYKDGEMVSLIRYPHGGIFEIPTLRVNNKSSQYATLFKTAPVDAIAIHPDVAERLSGADFDGDFVITVPNVKGPSGQIKTAPALEALKTFNPREEYKAYPGMPELTNKRKQRLMGDVSNLITDMTIKGATPDEIARAVKHSMVVIDAEKHHLNYKQSAIDNGISALKERYQGAPNAGAATLISKAKSREQVPHRKDYFNIDPVTGEKVYTYTGETYIDKVTGQERPRQTKSTKMAEYDPYDLSSGTVIESVYAEHATKLKNLANSARLEMINTSSMDYSPSARKTYLNEVESLDRKLNMAIQSRPIERKAQILANEIYRSKAKANPNMSGADRSKEKGRAIVLARSRINAKKPTIEITPREWEAIEMGAVSPTKLSNILRNANMDVVRKYATPRIESTGLSTAKQNRASALLKAGYTIAEVASAVGATPNQINRLSRGN